VEKAFSDFLILLATVDPVGTLALFVGLTASAQPRDRSKIALRCVGYSAAILVVFIALGQLLLGSLGIRLESFQLAGGIIFFLFGVQMVTGSGAMATAGSAEPGHDVAVFPLAVPSIASPGAILAVVVLTDNREFTVIEQATTAVILIGVLLFTLVLLLQANRVHGWIGDAGSTLLVRVLGLVLAALAVEMMLAAGGELILEMLQELPATVPG
jgi:multiple antibiotic resistance protein